MILKLLARLRRLRRSERGSATVEFVILFPLFFTLLLSSVESGVVMVRQMMLERGLDISVRAVRLGTSHQVSDEELREMICRVTGVIPNCMSELKVEMIILNPWAFNQPDPNADCVNRSEEVQVNRNFQNGASHQVMMLRACALFDTMLPNIGLGKRLSDDGEKPYALVSTSIFVMEPG
ncbi:TadE/TadG family type IV pilus assembly protein [Histidinibacterium lentulum]|uniref:Pilus assembly protein n=1 Tax=Histidinibacterium lentulum TaxID=2480588 RepID=A0A3N2R7I2_9RHOB|nr:TadE/TadG family type IV pilus assembly protein [Histidinibacterium lentulum]ROU03353.1 pilus assembly protein [Histidinibacterium lentulum]